MKTVIIIHGFSGHAGIHWQQWLHDELTQQGHKVLMPDLPQSEHPDRQAWLGEVRQVLEGVDTSQLVMVGHSLGVVAALDFIEQLDGRVDGLVSVAGFAEDYGADMNSYFLSQKPIDFSKIKNKLNWSAVIYGDNDPYVTPAALKYVADSLGVEPVVIPNGGHLNTESGFDKFPQLLEMIK